jgi:small GTP-binding protein
MKNSNFGSISILDNSRMTLQSTSSYERAMYSFKVILLGNVSVGKTALVSHFIDSTFTNSYSCTMVFDYRVKSLLIDENLVADLQIWDTCGQETYKSLTKFYYRDTQGN